MKIIDRYLLRQFVQVFIICFVSLTGLYVVFDAFSHLDEFLAYGEKKGNLPATMAEYYAVRSVAFFDRTSGILALIAAMFTVTWIQRHNELTALMAAGVTRERIVRPVLVAACAVSLVAMANRELGLPRLRTSLARDAKDLAGDTGRALRPRYDNDTEILIRGGQTFAAEKRIRKPRFLMPPMLDQYGGEYAAEDAVYLPADATLQRPAGYLFKKLTQPAGLAHEPSLKLGERVVVITPHDATWLAADECFIASAVDFEQLTAGTGWQAYSSTADLIRGLHNSSLEYGADVRVAIHARVVQPFLDATLLLLGLPLVLRNDNRNIFAAIGLCMAAVGVFMLVTIGCQYLGAITLLDATTAAWLPLLIFLPLAAFFIDPLWK